MTRRNEELPHSLEAPSINALERGISVGDGRFETIDFQVADGSDQHGTSTTLTTSRGVAGMHDREVAAPGPVTCQLSDVWARESAANADPQAAWFVRLPSMG